MSDAWSLGIQRLLRRLNSFYQPGSSKSKCKPFLVNTQEVGWIRDDAATQLRHYPDVFIEHTDRYESAVRPFLAESPFSSIR